MSHKNVIVATIRSTAEHAERATPRGGEVGVTFSGGQRGRIDVTDRRASGWLAALETLRAAGLPAYAEVDADSGLVTELLVPVAVRVGHLRDTGETVEVELIISQAQHRLRKGDPRYAELRDRLERAREAGAPVLVTERSDDHVIVDVRALPDDVPPPPTLGEAVPQAEAPEAGPEVSLSVANEMFALMNGRTCCSAAPTAPGIPFTYPDDGCWGRAHEMCRLMAARGVSSGKVWIYGSLKVNSANQPSCWVHWGWHVAPTLRVSTASGPRTYVVDPSLFTSPVPQETWSGVQGDPGAVLALTGSQVFYRSWSGSVAYDPTYTQTNQVLSTYRAQLQVRSSSATGPPPYPQCQSRPRGTQWLGTLGPHQSRRWFTHSWPAQWHVIWSAMPTSICAGAPQLTWSTAVERASSTRVTYWITVTNLTSQTIRFEGRYDVLSS